MYHHVPCILLYMVSTRVCTAESLQPVAWSDRRRARGGTPSGPMKRVWPAFERLNETVSLVRESGLLMLRQVHSLLHFRCLVRTAPDRNALTICSMWASNLVSAVETRPPLPHSRSLKPVDMVHRAGDRPVKRPTNHRGPHRTESRADRQ